MNIQGVGSQSPQSLAQSMIAPGRAQAVSASQAVQKKSKEQEQSEQDSLRSERDTLQNRLLMMKETSDDPNSPAIKETESRLNEINTELSKYETPSALERTKGAMDTYTGNGAEGAEDAEAGAKIGSVSGEAGMEAADRANARKDADAESAVTPSERARLRQEADAETKPIDPVAEQTEKLRLRDEMRKDPNYKTVQDQITALREESQAEEEAKSSPTERLTTNTEQPDQEVRQLQSTQTRLEQRVQEAKRNGDPEEAELSRQLRGVEAELRAKDNETYRKEKATYFTEN